MAKDRLFQRTGTSGFTLIEIMIVVGITGIIVAIATPTWFRQRLVAQQKVCQENLTKIDGAKEIWALEWHKSPSDSPAISDLYSPDGTGFLKMEPSCPSNGTYTLGTVSTVTTCTITEPRDHNALYAEE